MEVLTILGLLITTTAGVRFNVQSYLPHSEEGIMQPVFRDKFDVASIYPHLVYVAPGSGIVVSRINNNEETINYGRKIYQEPIPKSPLPSVNSLRRRGVTQRQISNEQFLKEVTPTTHTLLEKQDDKPTARFTPTIITSPEIENKKRNQYELQTQEEESDNNEEDVRPQYNIPNSDYRVLYVQGNQEDNNYNNRIVFVNLKPKATLSTNQLTKKVPLRKHVFIQPQEARYGYGNINEENPRRSLTNKNFAQFSLADNTNERMELDHNKQLLSAGLEHFHSNQKHHLQEELPEQEQYSFYIKQLHAQKAIKHPKYGDLGGSNSNVPESRSNKHKKLPVILRSRHGEQYQVNRLNPAISPDFQYENSPPYMQYATKERAVRIIQDEEE